MSEELSPEQIAEIRKSAKSRSGTAEPVMGVDAVLALCDTAAAYWGLKAELDRITGDVLRQVNEGAEDRAGLIAANARTLAELETLRQRRQDDADTIVHYRNLAVVLGLPRRSRSPLRMKKRPCAASRSVSLTGGALYVHPVRAWTLSRLIASGSGSANVTA